MNICLPHLTGSYARRIVQNQSICSQMKSNKTYRSVFAIFIINKPKDENMGHDLIPLSIRLQCAVIYLRNHVYSDFMPSVNQPVKSKNLTECLPPTHSFVEEKIKLHYRLVSYIIMSCQPKRITLSELLLTGRRWWASNQRVTPSPLL